MNRNYLQSVHPFLEIYFNNITNCNLFAEIFHLFLYQKTNIKINGNNFSEGFLIARYHGVRDDIRILLY